VVGQPERHRRDAAAVAPAPIRLQLAQRRVWAPIGQRPVAIVQHRFAWRYVVEFVHPGSGGTIFHLATSVNIPLFEAELADFARAAGASPSNQIVLVLDRAGWHTSLRLWVPEHVHLLFLPPYSPELQPAEHLWPLTNAALINRYFATIDELEEVQLDQCAELQRQPERIRSTTCFHWWPRQIHKRRGPRRSKQYAR
jgi:transposase